MKNLFKSLVPIVLVFSMMFTMGIETIEQNEEPIENEITTQKSFEAPIQEAPKVEAPIQEAPKVEAPKVEEPKKEEVKKDKPKKEEIKETESPKPPVETGDKKSDQEELKKDKEEKEKKDKTDKEKKEKEDKEKKEKEDKEKEDKEKKEKEDKEKEDKEKKDKEEKEEKEEEEEEEEAKGSIKISNTVKGSDGTEFDIFIDGPNGSLYTVSLKNGESITIKGLEAGNYKISTIIPMNYELVNIVNENISITEDNLDKSGSISYIRTNHSWFYSK